MGTLRDRLPALLQGVHPDWLPFFKNHGLLPLIETALRGVEPDAPQLAPAEDLIFEPFRYFGPDGALVLIVGQDPYPRDARGLSFSIPHGRPLKESLKTIVANLERRGLALPHFREKNVPASGRAFSGDLRVWAAQGVLLLNAALTTRIGTRGGHREHWKTFTSRFVRSLFDHAAETGRPLVCMLWGADARALAPAGSGRTLVVYHWTHPSPLINNRLAADARFENAPHFADANAVLRARGFRPIEWDPLGFSYAFTDGSCLRNGEPGAEASFAVLVLTGPLKNVRMAGRVAPHEYSLVDEADPLRGFAPLAATGAAPTNNRGEYLAWCWALLLLLRGGVRGRVEIVSDSRLFIQTMEGWLSSRRARGTETGLKNYDLVRIADRLLGALREAIGGDPSEGVRLTHFRAHQRRPPPEADPRTQVLWHENRQVDEAARALLQAPGRTSEDPCLDARSPALEWCLRGRFEGRAF